MKPVLLVLLAAAIGCGGPSASDTKDGRTTFQNLCATCHGPEGKPSESMVARLAVRDLTAPEFRAKVTPELVEHQIRAGSANKLMPSFEGVLDDAKIKAVAAYVASPQFIAPR
ncbi:MAG TPA: cytochrome c [Kofleriaceae bacterium]|nr:cytochrome c [Kofleriaceae bacterium]